MRFIQEPEAASTPFRRSSYVLRLVTLFCQKLIQSKEYCFMRSCKIFTNAYGKRGTWHCARYWKLASSCEYLYSTCFVVFALKLKTRVERIIPSNLHYRVSFRPAPSPLFDLWIQWSLPHSLQQQVARDNFLHQPFFGYPTRVRQWTDHVHSMAYKLWLGI